MRVCILFFEGQEEHKLLRKISQSLGKGIEKQGHQVDLINGFKDDKGKLFFYDYICIGSIKNGFFSGKIPEKIKSTFKNMGTVSGKRSYAFVVKNGFRSQKALSGLMKFMEGEGMFLKRSDIIKTTFEAEHIGKKLHIAR